MRKISVVPFLFVTVLHISGFSSASSYVPPTSRAHSNSNRRHGHSSHNNNDGIDATPESVKDYSNEVSSFFGNLRIPSSLFAGASAAAAFAMPLSATDGLVAGTVKRVYALLMMLSLSSQLLVVVVSTLSMQYISLRAQEPASSVVEFLRRDLELEWVAVRVHFLLGLIAFVLAAGLRAWVSIACPLIAKAALGINTSATLQIVAFIHDFENSFSKDPSTKMKGYIPLLLSRARTKPLFAVAFFASAVTWGYIIHSMPHIYHFLSSH